VTLNGVYDEDEAVAYDALYARIKDSGAEAAQVAALVRSRVPEAKSLLDVGCGTGHHLEFLASTFLAEGVELSAPMAAAARRRVPGATVHEGDMRTFDLGRRFDAVVCLFSAVGYMLTTEDLDKAVARTAAHVEPGGVLVIEPWYLPGKWLELEEGQVGLNLAEPTDELLVRMVRCWSEGEISNMEMHYLHGSSGAIRHSVQHHRLRLFTDLQYRQAFERAGLSVERLEPGLTGRGLYVGDTVGDSAVDGQ
jgi:dTDP-3-amino-3,6-dideoxy-alpha-D-glucopyranose N,N-dimethyltransferase/dTDP-3-amino-3,4,6-trideoxy-alpha-D-glucopyranose N,N-dimethyltransferase/N-methyltransferase